MQVKAGQTNAGEATSTQHRSTRAGLCSYLARSIEVREQGDDPNYLHGVSYPSAHHRRRHPLSRPPPTCTQMILHASEHCHTTLSRNCPYAPRCHLPHAWSPGCRLPLAWRSRRRPLARARPPHAWSPGSRSLLVRRSCRRPLVCIHPVPARIGVIPLTRGHLLDSVK
jgi:hypothetical protein